MTRLLFALILMLSMGSCATIFNKPYTTVHIAAPSQCAVSCRSGTSSTYEIESPSLPDTGTKYLAWLVLRDNVPIVIHTKVDSLERDIVINARRTAIYYLNFLVGYGVGALVDYWNPKSFGYPTNLKLYPYNMYSKGYRRVYGMNDYPAHQHEMAFAVPMTYISAYRYNYLTPFGTPVSTMIAYNYWHKRNQFLSLEFNASQKADIETFGKKNFDKYVYPREKIAATTVTISNYHRLGRIDLGYGLYMGMHSGRRYYMRNKMTDFEVYNASYISIGAQCSAQLKIAGPMYLGLNYQPQFLQLDKPGNFMYEHQFNTGIIWRIGVAKTN